MAAAKAEGSAAQDSDASHPVADVEAQGHEPTARTQRYIRVCAQHLEREFLVTRLKRAV